MRFWTLQLGGWFLVMLGLFIFYVDFEMLLSHEIVESAPVTVIGIFIFRGGIHLLKVAVAAGICSDLQRTLSAEPRVRGQESGVRSQKPRPLTPDAG